MRFLELSGGPADFAGQRQPLRAPPRIACRLQLERGVARRLQIARRQRAVRQLHPRRVSPGRSGECLEPRRIHRLPGEGGHRQRAHRLLSFAFAGQRSGAGQHLQHLGIAPQRL